MIGKAAGAEDQAASLVKSMKSDLAGIKEKRQPYLSRSKKYCRSVSGSGHLYDRKGTFMNEMLEAIHAEMLLPRRKAGPR
ncbi:hypothetical protein PO124_07865 [Bacillus licheniformis]|nr:hypothetical protein [Bacillus licheniformis]